MVLVAFGNELVYSWRQYRSFKNGQEDEKRNKASHCIIGSNISGGSIWNSDGDWC